MSAAQMTQLRPTINIDDLWAGDMTAVTVDDTSVLLVNVDGEVRAYENRCPHQAAALAEGDFDGVTITCIRHLWQFDADTGCGVNPATARLTPYPCQVAEDGTILVAVSG